MAKQPPRQLEGFFTRLGKHDAHPWEPLPWAGVSNKVLFSDPITGFTIELARVEQGAAFPEHYHTTMQTLPLPVYILTRCHIYLQARRADDRRGPTRFRPGAGRRQLRPRLGMPVDQTCSTGDSGSRCCASMVAGVIRQSQRKNVA